MKAKAEQLSVIVEDIISDNKKKAQLLRQPFIGVSKTEMLSELDKRIENGLLFIQDDPKFGKEDVDVVARNRFFRKSGGRMMILLVAIILAFAIPSMTFKIISPLIFTGLSGLAAAIFLYIYSKKEK